MSSANQHSQKLLRAVSRSFYLTLRVLPAAIRPQISLAYLLARATDTIADTNLVPVRVRLDSIRQLRSAIHSAAAGQQLYIPDLGELADAQAETGDQGSAAERVLLEKLGQALVTMHNLRPADRERILEVLETITRGQEMDLIRFETASAERIVALETDDALQEYTYCVAGCVGEFWTKMCLAHLLRDEGVDTLPLLTNGIRFGKGLQLVNILRDLPRDLRQGRCYIPESRLAELGLSPKDLLDPATMPRFRPLFDKYLDQASEQLAAGWDYTNELPRRQVRVRLACAWPALIGMKTLSLLRSCNVLDVRQRIKVSRPEIQTLIFRSVLAYPFPSRWSRLYPAPKNRQT
jgi:farnesyl-diphosphate farnesyltransferase